MSKKIELYKGEKFGKLKVIKEIIRKQRGTFYLCECECGNAKVIRKDHLIGGKIVSCGCYGIKQRRKSLITHGMSGTRFYRIYKNMWNRCYWINHPEFKYWGGKGVECEWKNFEEFKKDMYESYLEHCEKYGEKQTSIDRIDGNNNYCKENCRWATWKEQASNTKKKESRIKFVDLIFIIKKLKEGFNGKQIGDILNTHKTYINLIIKKYGLREIADNKVFRK